MKTINITNRHGITSEVRIPDSLTEGQAFTILNIIFNDYGDTYREDDGVLSTGQPWSNVIMSCGHVGFPEGTTQRSLSGYVGTLAQAGIVHCLDTGTEDASVCLTVEGVELIDRFYDAWDVAVYARPPVDDNTPALDELGKERLEECRDWITQANDDCQKSISMLLSYASSLNDLQILLRDKHCDEQMTNKTVARIYAACSDIKSLVSEMRSNFEAKPEDQYGGRAWEQMQYAKAQLMMKNSGVANLAAYQFETDFSKVIQAGHLLWGWGVESWNEEDNSDD